MRFLLWISQHFVLGRIYPGLSALWITVFALWITLAGLAVDYARGSRCGLRTCRPCGLRMLAHAVDYGPRPVDYGLRPVDYGLALWITGFALWITASPCGLRSRVSLWITHAVD